MTTNDSTWTVDDICDITDLIRAYLNTEAPELSAVAFNADLSEIAMRVWPFVEGRLRERLSNRAIGMLMTHHAAAITSATKWAATNGHPAPDRRMFDDYLATVVTAVVVEEKKP